MEKLCLEKGCKDQIAFVCKCETPAIYSCANHLGKHMMKPGNHTLLEPLLIPFDPSMSIEITNNAAKGIKSLQELRKNYISMTGMIIEKIMKESNGLMTKIERFEKSLQVIIKNAWMGKDLDKETLRLLRKLIVLRVF